MNKKIMKAEDSYDFYKEETLILHDRINKAITFCEDRSHWYINCQYTKLNLSCVINLLSDIIDILNGKWGSDNNDNR